MSGATTPGGVFTKLWKVAERAKRDPHARILALAHLLDVDLLRAAFGRLRKDAAAGVDEVTWEQYRARLDDNIRSLHERMKTGRYRHRPIRRVYLPKASGKRRPIGISTVEDKVVQTALAIVLGAIYEQDFLPCSYGFRPGRSAHDALRAVDAAAMRGEAEWVLEADIQSFFDSVDRNALMEMLRQRVADESFLRLVGKCLHVGVLDGEQYSEPCEGTVQGSTLSPLLGNIYLHHVLDAWFERVVKPRLRGGACLVRYADDFVIGFGRRDDAERVAVVLCQRMDRYGLRLHPDKTRLLSFGRPSRRQAGGKGLATFDFLGFTVFWWRTRKGVWATGFKTRKARLQRAIRALAEFCRSRRHDSVVEQHTALCSRIRGHYNYFGVNGNFASLARLERAARWLWLKWLRRRSQRTRLTRERYEDLLEVLPLPPPRIMVQVWSRGSAP